MDALNSTILASQELGQLPLAIAGAPGVVGTHRLIARLTAGGPVPTLGILLCVTLVVRFVGMISVPLVPEEAYYWMYAQHPNLSYYDHPPMVAWLIGAGTWIFGNNEFGVRVAGNLMMFGASGLLYLFGRWWFGRSAGLLSAAMLHILPVYYGIGFLATMDSALLFFWALGLVGVTLALRRSHPSGWYLAGVALGGTLLTKYTGVFLAAGTGLALLAHRPWRRQLLTIHPYLAFLLAVALFSPVIVWNARHDWASFRFQFVERWDDDPAKLKLFGFVIWQLLVLTPVLLAGVVMMLARITRKRRLLQPRWVIALCFSLPLMLVMTLKSLRHDIHINWTTPAYLCLLPAAAWSFLAHLRARRRAQSRTQGQTQGHMPNHGVLRWRAGMIWTSAVCMLINFGLMAYLLTMQPRWQLLSAFGPWRELAAVVEVHEEQLEKTSGREPLIVADGKYRLASVLAFYRASLEIRVRSSDFTTSQWWLVNGGHGLGYPYWAKPDLWARDEIIFVCDGDDPVKKVRKRFREVSIVYDSKAQYPKRYQVAVCRGLLR